MDHCWGIVRAIVDLLLNMDEGKYLLVKDPNKDLMRLYHVPGAVHGFVSKHCCFNQLY